MKIVFFGSGDFGVTFLESLKDNEEVICVVTQPDRKKGRALRISVTPVKQSAQKLGMEIFQPVDINDKASIKYLGSLKADLFIVISFGQIFRKPLLEIPKYYAINVHASLLPRYRGAAPINWALANGEMLTGVTIIKMDERMDAGDILLQKGVPVADDDDALSLSRKLGAEGNKLLMRALELIEKNQVEFVSQDDSQATYAPQLKKQDGLIDWRWSAGKIYNRIRGFIPWPGCFTYWNKKMLKIWKARPIAGTEGEQAGADAGAVIDIAEGGIVIKTGKGNLCVEQVQLEGRRRMSAAEFTIGCRDLVKGVRLGV